MPRHGVYPRDIVPPRSKYSDAGRFGRMFGELPPFAADTPDAVSYTHLDVYKRQ